MSSYCKHAAKNQISVVWWVRYLTKTHTRIWCLWGWLLWGFSARMKASKIRKRAYHYNYRLFVKREDLKQTNFWTNFCREKSARVWRVTWKMCLLSEYNQYLQLTPIFRSYSTTTTRWLLTKRQVLGPLSQVLTRNFQSTWYNFL